MTAFPNSETGKNFSSPKSVRWRQFRKKTSSSRIFGGGGGGCAVAIQFQFVYQTFPPTSPVGSRVRRGKKLFFLPRFGEKGVCLSSLFRVSCRLGSGVPGLGLWLQKPFLRLGSADAFSALSEKDPEGKQGNCGEGPKLLWCL